VGQFLSYARLVRCEHESAGKKLGCGSKKVGNAHLRWAFAEAVCLFLRGSERARAWKQKQEKKHGSAKVLGILAARLARAVYHMLRKHEAFDEERFWSGQARPAPSSGTTPPTAAPAAGAAGSSTRRTRRVAAQTTSSPESATSKTRPAAAKTTRAQTRAKAR